MKSSIYEPTEQPLVRMNVVAVTRFYVYRIRTS